MIKDIKVLDNPCVAGIETTYTADTEVEVDFLDQLKDMHLDPLKLQSILDAYMGIKE